MPESRTPSTSPPRLACWLLSRVIPARWRDALIGDLEEEFHDAIARGVPPATARRAFWRDGWRSAADLWRHRPSLFARSQLDLSRAEPPAAPRPRPSANPRPAGDSAMSALLFDLRYALRSLRRSPGFTTVIVSTLALGIGCLTAFWSLFDAVLLRPLPFAEPDRLVQLWGEDIEHPGGRSNSSYPDFQDLQAETQAFDRMAVYQTTFANLTRDDARPERLPITYVSADFFATLGLNPTLGRELGAADEAGSTEPAVVIGPSLWRRAFGGSPDVIGRTVRVDGSPRTIVGIAPDGLDFPKPTDLWLPVTALGSVEQRGVHSLRWIGRLAPSVSIEQAGSEASLVATRLRETYPESNARRGLRIDPLHESMVGATRPRLALVAAAAGLLLLIVCANVSSLLLERATRRGREVATRSALGASVGQLVRGFLAEASVLVALGGLGGLAVARIARQWLLDAGPALPRSVSPALDLRTLGLATLVTVGLGALLALVPAAHTIGRDLYGRLGAGAVGFQSPRQSRWRSTFVVTQVALAVILTLGAALLAQSLGRLSAIDPGYDPEGLLTAELEVSTPYVSDEWPATVAFYEGLIEELEAMPGVESAAAAHQHPADPGWSTSFTIAGEPAPEPGFEPEANFRPVTDGYFRTIGLPLVRGQTIDRETRSAAPGRVVVNQAFVDHFLPEGDPIGRRLVRDNWWIDEIDGYEIVGVVANSRFAGLDRAPRPAMYFPHRQDVPPSMTVLVKAAPGIDPLALSDALRSAVWSIDPELPIGRIATLDELAADRLAPRRFVTWLSGLFAMVAVGLAALGLYGVLAYATARRTRELGLRMALGARAPQLRRLVLGQGLRLAAAGAVLGVVASWGTGRWIEAFLYGVGRSDPATFAGVGLLFVAVALGAGWLPAWRATRIDPCRALAED